MFLNNMLLGFKSVTLTPDRMRVNTVFLRTVWKVQLERG